MSKISIEKGEGRKSGRAETSYHPLPRFPGASLKTGKFGRGGFSRSKKKTGLFAGSAERFVVRGGAVLKNGGRRTPPAKTEGERTFIVEVRKRDARSWQSCSQGGRGRVSFAGEGTKKKTVSIGGDYIYGRCDKEKRGRKVVMSVQKKEEIL